MMTFESLAGLAIILVSTAVMVIGALLARRGKRSAPFRPIPALARLRQAMGLGVEEGKRLHITLGKASILDANNASALVGLSTLERVAQMSMISDRPPIATSGDGALALLSQDALRATYQRGNAAEQYDPDLGRLAGTTAFSYTAGAMPVVHDEQVMVNVIVGNFGPEVALLTEASEQNNAFSLAASDSLPAQAVLYATADEALIGEELFAIPAYLNASPIHQSSLRAQDLLRWLLVLAMIVGMLVKLIELFTGATIL
ncbi:MAG: hypothetical protein HPY76_10450 [Anaerolineae bacterium]|jgi:hypothetical protein|nr:hypothetical protein [Anaerolineae bacterium]